MKQPTLFLAHGAPPLLDDAKWMSELKTWGDALGRPKNILMVSAHWEERPVTLGATTTVPLFYDFYGFPERYYQVQYPSPGAPELAKRVKTVIKEVADDPKRGLDHGAFIPLIAMYPDAKIPVLQVSLPTLEPKALLELGRSLAPLRDEGTLIIGSGFLVHNLRALFAQMQRGDSSAPQWMVEFESWVTEALDKRDVDSLLQYRTKAPAVNMALPTHEHFVPLFVALGAALEDRQLSYPITGAFMAATTKRSVQFG